MFKIVFIFLIIISKINGIDSIDFIINNIQTELQVINNNLDKNNFNFSNELNKIKSFLLELEKKIKNDNSLQSFTSSYELLRNLYFYLEDKNNKKILNSNPKDLLYKNNLNNEKSINLLKKLKEKNYINDNDYNNLALEISSEENIKDSMKNFISDYMNKIHNFFNTIINNIDSIIAEI